MLPVLLKIAAALSLARFAIVLAVFIPLERLIPQRRGQAILRDGWLTDFLCYLINGCLFVAILWIWHRTVPAFSWLKPLPFALRTQSFAVQCGAFLVVESFVTYWAHRALHRFPFLWRFHAVHHSATQLDWLASYRNHIGETFYYTTIISAPLVLFGVSPPMIFAFVAYRFIEGHVEHSNLRLPLGPLRWIVPSPWFHQWHHAYDVEARDKNFSRYPIWDILFGTAFMPAGRYPERFGIDDPLPSSYPGQLAYPLGLGRSQTS